MRGANRVMVMTDVVIQISSEIGRREATTVLTQLVGAPVGALFPGTDDPEMQSWLHVALPSDRDADEVVRELVDHRYVESAYVKPPESVP